ncbi:hypothetical protein KZ483_20760 [Paenibacillus sp. sptzw28]|uniref:hypothetical protein n=1 Tax=Paenibacillus sp. sptzw28 TaxID=715179 RepID=UPI001C6EA95B|nr:hypothetical protein [Paenibacillus sp. sptzw28]QYR20244.1 hypothetical protein KZ483_20760 [Paenibacillus sp. sptzw28]
MNTEVLLPTAVIIIIMTLVYFNVRASGRYNNNLPIITAKAYIIKKRIERWSGGTNAPLLLNTILTLISKE